MLEDILQVQEASLGEIIKEMETKEYDEKFSIGVGGESWTVYFRMGKKVGTAVYLNDKCELLLKQEKLEHGDIPGDMNENDQRTVLEGMLNNYKDCLEKKEEPKQSKVYHNPFFWGIVGGLVFCGVTRNPIVAVAYGIIAGYMASRLINSRKDPAELEFKKYLSTNKIYAGERALDRL